jgi:para-aminobenzoate synthetase
MSGGGVRVLAERLDASLDVDAVFEALFLDSTHAFWLDRDVHHGPDGTVTGITVLGDASGPMARVACADVLRGTVRVTTAGETRVIETGFFDWLDAELAQVDVQTPGLPFDFALGWVGYLGYELKAECGGARAHHTEDPDALLVFADRAVVFDHRAGAVYLLTMTSGDDQQPARSWLADTATRLATVASAPNQQSGDEPASPPVAVTLRHSRADYLDMIARCQEAISAGESYEVCLTNMVTARMTTEVWPAYLALRRISPAPFAALLRFGDLSVLSASPERFLRITEDGDIESKPIKGTRPRGATPEQDHQLRADLASNDKDRAENLMIVDLVRNDLSSCAETGSVRVPRIFHVETYATVHQLVSTVHARLRRGISPVQCVRAAFPGGSMTGAPKVRTMELIDALERGPRGVYSGAIGYFSVTGAVDLSMVIRTLVVRGDRASFGVGGAIIAPSDPIAEFEETAVKAAPMLRLLNAEFPHGD